jgi:DNA-directed RNA polymerase subunit RPC12/RpoP
MHVPFKEKQLLLVKQRPEDITCPNCKTRMPVVCAWCGNPMGEKDGQGQTGTSHGICPDCLNKHFPHHADKINQILGTKLKKEVTSGKSK